MDPALRSRGIGAGILDRLRARYPGRDLIVEVEPPEEESENALQRQRRMDFYLRNGFHDLNRHVTGNGVRYTVLSTGTELDSGEYWRIFQIFPIGPLSRAARLQKRWERG